MTAVRTAPPASARLAVARIGVELRLYFRDLTGVTFTFVYPVLMLVIFASVFANETVAGGVTFAQYFLAGIAATGIILTSFQALGVDIALERESGELARLQALGCPATAYFAGKAGRVIVCVVAELAMLLIVARFAFDVPLPPDASHWLTFAWVSVLGTLAGTVLGIGASLLVRRASSAGAVIAAIALVLQFFSGVFFVFTDLPVWMRQVAAVFPLKWLTQGMRSVFLPDAAARAEVAGSWEHGRTALVLAVWVIIGIVVCARGFRWRAER